mgnify:CR=1 FL=1
MLSKKLEKNYKRRKPRINEIKPEKKSEIKPSNREKRRRRRPSVREIKLEKRRSRKRFERGKKRFAREKRCSRNRNRKWKMS